MRDLLEAWANLKQLEDAHASFIDQANELIVKANQLVSKIDGAKALLRLHLDTLEGEKPNV